MADDRDASNDPTGTRRRVAVVTWVWLPAVLVIAVIIWLVVRALT